MDGLSLERSKISEFFRGTLDFNLFNLQDYWVRLKLAILSIAISLLGLQVASADQTVDPHILPNFYDFSIPKYTQPAISIAARDYPTPYFDGCHTQQNMASNSASCTYGNKKSKTTIVLFGDSHALSWFPAIEKLAIYKNWKLISLTMSSCWPADIPAWNSTTNLMMDNCEIWRSSAITLISKIKPKYIFVAGTSGFSTVDSEGNVLKGDDRFNAWQEGMNKTLQSLKASTNSLFYLADYPIATPDPISCIKANKTIKNCVMPLEKAISFDWLQKESDIANENGAIFVDGTEWICQTDPCSPIAGNYLIYRDAGHLTSTFARTLFTPLYANLKRYLI